MAFLKQSEVKSLPEVELEKLFAFCRKREQARITGTSDDPIISKARFCNIFREDDKVSKMLFDSYRQVEGDKALWDHIVLGRLINRVDVLQHIFPMTKRPDLSQFEVLVNSHAYQLHPGIGRSYGVKSVKEFVRNHWHEAAERTFYSITNAKGTSINNLTQILNKKFGGAALFYVFQCVLDYGQIKQTSWLDTEPFHGAGAQIKGVSLQEVCDAQRIMWPDAKRPFMLFDAEHSLCEFRKYSTWSINGIAKARRREK